MAIRDRFRRALHKSDSSDTISQTESNTTTATTSETSSLHKTPSNRFTRTFTFSRHSKDDSDKESKKRQKQKNKKIHPSQRPLTLQNLKHQEMLGAFSMTFGASDPSQIESASFIGVSPCCTRAPSLEIDRAQISPSGTDSPNTDWSETEEAR